MLTATRKAVLDSGWRNYLRHGYQNCVLDYNGLYGGGGTVIDCSGQGNDGTIVGATWERTKDGLWYLSYDGNDDQVTLAAQTFDTLTDATIMCWFWYETKVANVFLLGQWQDTNNRINPFVQTSGLSLQMELFVGGVKKEIVSAAGITAQLWYHAAFLLGTGGMKMYIDNVVEADTDVSEWGFADIAASTKVEVGAVNTSSTMSGNIGQFLIFSKRLSLAEMIAHREGTKVSYPRRASP